MLTRLMAAAVFAGLVAGVLAAGFQSMVVTPLIFKAEKIEHGDGGTEPHAAHNHSADHDHAHAADEAGDGHDHDHNHEGWMPADGLERLGFTVLSTVATTIGYALLLAALMTIAGVPLTVPAGVGWAIGAFAATALAPGLGLSPTLPGMAETALQPRQLWWIATALATAGGLYLLAYHYQNLIALAAGVAVIVLPHIFGAPPADLTGSDIPARLASQFASASYAQAFLMWLAIGIGLGFVASRNAASASDRSPAGERLA